MTKKLAPMHLGEVLREEFLVPFKLSARLKFAANLRIYFASRFLNTKSRWMRAKSSLLFSR
jgi:plasmid maintenance system antidote protein VapI